MCLAILVYRCLRYCKSTIFQANHNWQRIGSLCWWVVCDTAKVRFFKQITTQNNGGYRKIRCLRYCKSTIFQANHNCTQCIFLVLLVVCDTAKVRFFKQITTDFLILSAISSLFAILQKYDFSSKSQRLSWRRVYELGCLRYCKSTIFQANHNKIMSLIATQAVVCDTAKVRFFKQITTFCMKCVNKNRCLRYCKSTIFQANHNTMECRCIVNNVVCDTAKVRFFKQITTQQDKVNAQQMLFAILQKYDFSSKSQLKKTTSYKSRCCLRYCKSTIFQANHNENV